MLRTLVALLGPPVLGLVVAMVVASVVRDRNLVVSKAPPSGLQWSPVTSDGLPPAPAVDRVSRGVCSARLDSQPSGAEVTVNGKSLGKTPLDSAPVPCGTLSVTMTRDHYRPQTRKVEAVPGTTLELTVRLRRAIGVETGQRESPAGGEISTVARGG